MTTPRNFETDLLNYGTSAPARRRHLAILANTFNVPRTAIRPATREEEASGIDYAVSLPGGRVLNVDVKERSLGAQPFSTDPNTPEVPIETVSVVEHRIPGPVLRQNVSTDVYLFSFASVPDTAYVVSYGTLREAALSGAFDAYTQRVQVSTKGGQTYHSACRFVPVSAISGMLTIPTAQN